MGLQLVAPPGRESELLCAALVLENALGILDRVPVDPRPTG